MSEDKMPDVIYADSYPEKSDCGLWFDKQVNHPSMPKNKYYSEFCYQQGIEQARKEERENSKEIAEHISEYANNIFFHLDSETTDLSQKHANYHIKHFVYQILFWSNALLNAGTEQDDS